MQVVSFVSQKGGSGKSTLAISCAVAAKEAGKRVILLDLDPQETASDWYKRREEETPQVERINSNELSKVIKGLYANDVDIALIDTPGRDAPATNSAMRVSHACVIPSQTSPADLVATKPTVRAIERLQKPIVFVLNQVQRGRGGDDTFRVREAEAGLRLFGIVSPIRVGRRMVHQDAFGAALGVTEFEPEGVAAAEIRDLWKWLNRKMGKLNGKS